MATHHALDGDHGDLKTRAVGAACAALDTAWRPEFWTIAPGRIELIGNHIDYNGGPVLAGAINHVIAVGVGPNPDANAISVVAPDVSDGRDDIAATAVGDWHATADDAGPGVYVKGIIAALNARGIPFRRGVTLAMAGDIPPGFGMSSSAAFCLATILALTDAAIPPREMVAIARDAEHRAGSPVGAMDQSASVAGGVILFDGTDASYTTIDPDLEDYVFAVADSGVDRALRTSSYGTRVRESNEALAIINEALATDLPSLAAISGDQWREISSGVRERLGSPLFERVRHVVTETQRVRDAERALRATDWPAFGALMNASGDSSAGDYAISHPLVEQLVHELRGLDGVLGARMMGGGEGGPALALLRRDAIGNVQDALDHGYYARHRVAAAGPHVRVCVFGPGAHREP
jgi:galactokinase